MRWWTGLLIFGPPAFFAGFAIGRFSVTHKEFVMTIRARIRAWFDRWVRVLFALLAVTATIGVLGAATAIRQSAALTKQQGRDLVTNCENANESRAAARALWGYIVDVSEAGNPDPTRRQKRTIANFREYVDRVYAPRDCTDLSKKYNLPQPPPVIEPTKRSDS